MKLSLDLMEEMKEADDQVTKATVSLDPEDFRLVKVKQNKLNRKIEKERANQLKENLMKKNKWKTVNNETKNDNRIPTRIICNGIDIPSPKDIANEMNQYFTKKIKKMRNNLNGDTSKAMKVLEKLIKKLKSEFELKPVNVNKVYEVIQKSKASNSMGHDNLSMNIIK